MAYDVFISYKSQYVDIVKAICHVLESDNVRCWYAPRDLDKNRVGYDYDDSIMRAISNCKAVVVILTNEALDSEWVKMEISQAQKKGKIIIPYVVNEITKENGLLMRLQNKHWIDAYPNPERKFSLLSNNVKLLLNESHNEEIYTIEDYDSDFDYEEGEALYLAKEYDEAVAALAASAERGNKKASAMICQLFYELENQLDKISNETWDLLERQAKAGHEYACFAMHTKYYKDYENYYISFDYLKKAARDKSLGLAFLRLGIHYGWGMGVRPNHTLSLHYYKKAIELGCAQAYSYIGQEFEHGSDKLLPDIEKALEYYRKGAEKNDTRSICRLGNCYADGSGVEKNKDEAFRLFEKAADLGMYSAYCQMGYCCQAENDIDNATKYYKKAAKYDEGEAFANLAIIYYNKEEREDAYRWAKSGFIRKNGHCAFVLGWLYEQDGKYKEAWDSYFARYKWVGVGAEDLASLYLDMGYRPEGTTLDEIITMLDVTARNCNEDAIDRLIKIYSDDTFACKDLKKAAEYIKLGASIGIPNKMYEFGLSFMGDNEEIFNAYKGLEWIEKAARKEHLPAIEYLLEAFAGDKYEDKEKLAEWSSFAARLNLDSEKTYQTIRSGLIGANAGNELKAYLTHIIENRSDNAISALETLLDQHFKGFIMLDSDEFKHYAEQAFDYISTVDGTVDDSLVRLRLMAHRLDPEFSPSEVEKGQIMNGKLFDKYYRYYCGAQLNLIDLDKKDEIMSRLYAPMREDPSFEEVKTKPISDIAGVEPFWNAPNRFFDIYEDLCKRFAIRPVGYRRIEHDQLYPFIPSCLADSFGRDALRCFISMHQSGQSDIMSCKQPISADEMMCVAEKCTDLEVQDFLVAFIEIYIEIESVLLDNHFIYRAYNDNDMDGLSHKLNGYKSRLDGLGIKNSLPSFNADIINGLMHETEQEPIEAKPADDFDDDEFIRLLDEFIKSQSEENDDEHGI